MQQDRLAALRQREVDCNGLLEIQERQELWALERAARKVEWARIPAQKTPEQRMIELLGLRWAAGSLGGARTLTPRHRQVQILGMRWPRKPLSGKLAQLETLRQRWPT
jgi:hypothetical protein